MEVTDSGTIRAFDSGAHRDNSVGKGRCDLLPLLEASEFLEEDEVLAAISAYQETQDAKHIQEALAASLDTVPQFNNCKSTLLLEASKQFEEGAEKYGENNWKLGIPVNVFLDSAIRHYLKTLRGDTDEPHWRAFAWNLLSALWTVKQQMTNQRKQDTEI